MGSFAILAILQRKKLKWISRFAKGFEKLLYVLYFDPTTIDATRAHFVGEKV